MSSEIPGNEHSLERLRDLLARGRAVAFVGAGASAGLYPLWFQLLRLLADEAVKRDLAKPSDREFWLGRNSPPLTSCGQIRSILGEGPYNQFLYNTFKRRHNDDGRSYTAVHAGLVTLPFRGIVTTNYDPGLLEARLALRTDVGATGHSTWEDREQVHRWYTGEIFEDEQFPILFAHGIFDRPRTIILAADDYERAYENTTYKAAFEKLIGQENLVFVGFSFSDPWFEFLSNLVVRHTAALSSGDPRHVALIGLSADEEQTLSIYRLNSYRTRFNTNLCFYRVVKRDQGGDDHSDLERLLRDLQQSYGSLAIERSSEEPSGPTRGHPPQCWVHKTTEDGRYVGRHHAHERLDRWATDTAARVIAISGLGGLGKTALIGQWLKHVGGDTRRDVRFVFFWSFYINRSMNDFLRELLKFAQKTINYQQAQRIDLVEEARELLRAFPVLVVMDGLEVLQEWQGHVDFGMFLDNDLRDFLTSACRIEHRGLLLLTSRFPFPDLSRYSGLGLRVLDLDQLTPSEGAQLLQRCDVGGTERQRCEVSERFEGHPLALRIFSRALSTHVEGDPTRFMHLVFDQENLRPDDPLEAKLKRLLVFYEHQIPSSQRTILGLISLFRVPVDEKILRRLAQNPAVVAGSKRLSTDEIRGELRTLCRDHFVIRQHETPRRVTYSCHPILLDHFRGSLLGQNHLAAEGVADLLKGRPASGTSGSLREIELVLSAIEVLLAVGAYKRADELFRTRLDNGYIFQRLPAPHEGLRCARNFVADQRRRVACEKHLGLKGLSFYLNSAGLRATFAGELKMAVKFYDDAADVKKRLSDFQNLLAGCQNKVLPLALLGRLDEAEEAADEALNLSQSPVFGGVEAMIKSLQCKGYVSFLRGRTSDASQCFETADRLHKEHFASSTRLHGLSCIWWAEFLLSQGALERCREVTEANLALCQKHSWKGDIAACEIILGRLDLKAGDKESSRARLAGAETTMRNGQILTDLPEALLAKAELLCSLRSWGEAVEAVNEVLDICAPRHMCLFHIRTLLGRSRIWFEEASQIDAIDTARTCNLLETARDDAEGGLGIAQSHGFAHLASMALALLADICGRLGDNSQANRYRNDARAVCDYNGSNDVAVRGHYQAHAESRRRAAQSRNRSQFLPSPGPEETQE